MFQTSVTLRSRLVNASHDDQERIGRVIVSLDRSQAPDKQKEERKR